MFLAIFGLLRGRARPTWRPMPPLLYLKDTNLTFGTTRLLDGAELAVGEGERLAGDFWLASRTRPPHIAADAAAALS